MPELSLTLLHFEPQLEHELARIKELAQGIDRLHIDVMRPDFIENTAHYSETRLKLVCDQFASSKRIDFHLMTNNPEPIIKLLISLIPKERRRYAQIGIHRESCREQIPGLTERDKDLFAPKPGDAQQREIDGLSLVRLHAALQKIRAAGMRTCLVLEPTTSLESIAPLSAQLDAVLIMSIVSGAGGREFMPTSLDRIAALRVRYPKLEIHVDGGVNAETGRRALQAGADVLVVGTYITAAPEPIERIKALQRLLSGS